jgi:abortive infection bacteriophage resistance protein
MHTWGAFFFNTMKFDKKPLSIDDQIALLKTRGLRIPDEKSAKQYLSNISYYRLSAYMLPFQKKDGSHEFIGTVSFQDIITLYSFDRALKLIVFDAIERIEIAIRTKIVHTLSMKYGSHWHEDARLFTQKQVYFNLQKCIADHCAQKHKETFIEHYLGKYDDPAMPPSWMSLELVTLGQLSLVYNSIKDDSIKKEIASYFGMYPVILQSWAHSITYVRNTCAHHSRLWNRELGVRPIILTVKKPLHPWISKSYTNNARMYYFLCCTYYFLKTINPNGHFKDRLFDLVSKYPEVPIQFMGFPGNWREEKLWQS